MLRSSKTSSGISALETSIPSIRVIARSPSVTTDTAAGMLVSIISSFASIASAGLSSTRRMRIGSEVEGDHLPSAPRRMALFPIPADLILCTFPIRSTSALWRYAPCFRSL